MKRVLASLFSSAAPPPQSRTRLSVSAWPAIIYAIGDVHGCLDELLRLEAKIIADGAAIAGERWIVMLGDYVDRGPASAQVVEHLRGPAPSGFRRFCLAGNHEAMMLDFLAAPDAASPWLQLGGTETLASYGVDVARFLQANPRQMAAMLKIHIPPEHIGFLRDLPSAILLPGLMFAHAGVDPAVSRDQQSDEDLLWMREPFLSASHLLDYTVVHGHTPGQSPIVTAGRIGIDTGAFATGILTAVALESPTNPRFLDTRLAQG